MTNTELISKIKAEIERRYDYEKKMYCDTKPDGRPNDGWAESLAIMGVLEELRSFIDTLEKEKPINPDDAMKELDEKIALVKQRGTWDGVDVDKYMDEVRGREPEKPMGQEKEVKPCHRTRKKLAEWSKTQEGRESYEKVAEEMRKQIVPNDLEEAANEYEKKHTYQRYDGGGLTPEYDATLAESFIAGAKWQAKRMKDEKEKE